MKLYKLIVNIGLDLLLVTSSEALAITIFLNKYFGLLLVKLPTTLLPVIRVHCSKKKNMKNMNLLGYTYNSSYSTEIVNE